jgi:4-hydroxy-tetrahydrodipicolinate synthase
MNAEKKFVPVMITPFNLKAKVDFDVVSNLIDFYLAAGVKGFFANCLSSEMYSISEASAKMNVLNLRVMW